MSSPQTYEERMNVSEECIISLKGDGARTKVFRVRLRLNDSRNGGRTMAMEFTELSCK